MLLLHSTCGDLITRFLPNIDAKIKVYDHIICTTVLPTAASKTEKSTDNLQVIAQKILYSTVSGLNILFTRFQRKLWDIETRKINDNVKKVSKKQDKFRIKDMQCSMEIEVIR